MTRRVWIATLATAFVCALAVRWAAVERAGARVLDADEREYLDIGVGAARLGVLAAEPAIPTAVRGPLGPSWISLLQGGRGPASPAATRRLQAVVSSLGVFVLFALGAMLDEKRGLYAGAAAAFAFALHPDLAFDAALLRTEWIDALFTALACVSLLAWIREPSRGRSAALGAVLGLSLLSRSTMALAVPALACAGFAARGRLGPARRWLPPLLLAAALPALPWAARNAARFKAFIPFERGAAPLIFYYTSLGMPASDGLVRYEALALAEEPGLADLDSVARMRSIAALARANIARAPGRYAGGVLRRLSALWEGHGLLLLLAGLGLLAGRRRPEAWALAGAWGYYNLHAFADLYALRLNPGLIPLIALASLLASEAAGRAGRLPEFPLPPSGPRGWPVLCALALACPGFWTLAREAAAAAPAGSPEPKVFLDRVVADARAGRTAEALAALDAGAPSYPGYAALHLSHAALLQGAGHSAAACASLRRAGAVIAPLGEYRTDLTERIRAGLSTCN